MKKISIILASEGRKSNLYSDDIFDDKNLLFFSLLTFFLKQYSVETTKNIF
jgi:hypothetical protein